MPIYTCPRNDREFKNPCPSCEGRLVIWTQYMEEVEDYFSFATCDNHHCANYGEPLSNYFGGSLAEDEIMNQMNDENIYRTLVKREP